MPGVINGVQVFPDDNIWNRPINTLPVHPNSTVWLNSIGGSGAGNLTPGYGPSNVGIPFVVVDGTQPYVAITFNQYPSQCDPGPNFGSPPGGATIGSYPVPSTAPIEQFNTDHHVLVIDTANSLLYELWAASLNGGGPTWTAGSGAIFDLTSDNLRTNGWTSADAAGLPIFPGLVRYDEVATGAINHALRCVVDVSQNTYLWPARHQAGSANTALAPLGIRIRLKASFDVSSYSAFNQIILNCLKTYGMFIADNGAPTNDIVLSGAPDNRWNSSDVTTIQAILINTTNFEIVDESALQVSANTANAAYSLTGSGSTEDLTLYKRQIVRVLNAAGTFLNVWNDAPLLSGFKESINTGGSPLVVSLPRPFDNFGQAGLPHSDGSVAQGNVVQYWLYGPGLPQAGLLRFQGVIDKIEPGISSQGAESVNVTITPFSAVIGDRGVTNAVQIGVENVPSTYDDPTLIFDWFFSNNDDVTGLPYMQPLTLDPANPATSGNSVQYTFSNQTMDSVFQTVLSMMPPGWFYRFNPDKSVTRSSTPTTAQHLFYLGEHLIEPKYSQDWTVLRNVIALTGANVGIKVQTTLTSGLTLGSPYTSIAVAATTDTLYPGDALKLNDVTQFTVGSGHHIRKKSQTVTQTVVVAAQANAGATSITVYSFTASANFAASSTTVQSQTILSYPLSSVATGSDLATYGERLYMRNDSRIKDPSTLAAIAQGLLVQLDQALLRCPIKVVDYRGDSATGLGYDIESIKVGDTVTLVDTTSNLGISTLWDVATWDVDSYDFTSGAAFNTVIQVQELSYFFDYVELQLGYQAPNATRRLASIMTAFQDWTMLQP